MSSAELIFQKATTLPADMQREALNYVDYLLQRQAETSEAREWGLASAAQLASQYCSDDAIYDQD